MFSDVNVKVIIGLFCLSIAAFLSHRLGILDTSYSVLVNTEDKTKNLITSKHADAYLTEKRKILLQCKLTENNGYNFCGIGIPLTDGIIDNGLDLSRFNRLSLAIKYTAPNENAKLKITFRNFNDNYSKLTDTVSLKFNSISYNPNRHKLPVDIPFDALQVDNWWVEQYKVGFTNSQVELTNVSYLEILTDGMNVIGNYNIEIQRIDLYGKLISEANLLKLILLIWLITIILLITLQRNVLHRMSITDSLTGLYNRQGIRSWTNKKILMGINRQHFYMFYLDLDDFKKVNDTYGHQVGDQLLIGFSHYVENYLDSIENIQFAFARLSGDEFALVVLGLEDEQIKTFAENLIGVWDSPIVLEQHETYARASLGVAKSSGDVKTFDGLLARADSAMYYAKKEGKNCFKVFNEKVSQDIFFRKQTAEKIKNAIIHDQFHLNFMPIFDAKSLKIVSIEVLIRANTHELLGIGPDVFIPIAEEYNLIKSIDLWVIETTFKQIKKEFTFLHSHPLTFCINISSVELHNPTFVQQLTELISLYQIDPTIIELEITETCLVAADLMSVSTLEEIHDLGINLTLDDFGTGYTAFSQLINYPVSCLKIDKTFIDNLNSEDKTTSTMIKAILSIADSYQLKTVGEGVENHQQYEFLLDQGCDMLQGYLFSKPLLWKDLKNKLSETNQQPFLFKK
ncbi:bifunctional diguanylate cyclase/phosphodiesterase [Psychromonas sp. SR45-3]|uniref:putative bifunctional diguanylate cyclase/phosphodiesterase n=1 Tax=Psychromonas sp. SR45-3 TaxID=2760930 RepID=UPI0015F86284|nr:GGDEF and EAL domain-containing protein [Psychromonas sp. SR45-3]MBB1274492.1 GGDEF and EAL domain-containing protein [Psychromonas sp. SR45-3]